MSLARPIKLLLGAAAGIVLLAAGGTFVYIHFVEKDAPDRFTLSSERSTSTTSASSSSSGVDGTWKVSSGSQAGYRVKEILFGQDNTAVGRTSSVTGTVTLAGTRATAATITVDLTKVSSDQSRRDAQFHGRIMNTSTYPTATFRLTQPVEFGSVVPADGAVVDVKATGTLTVHGTTRTVTVDLQTKKSGSSIEVVGQVPVTFADYHIPNPTFGPITTQDHGILEFSLVLHRS